MAQFRDRATGKIHTTLVSPDGGMVHGVHENLQAAHSWAEGAMNYSRKSNPPAHGDVETWTHKSDSTGSMIGVGQNRVGGSSYTPAVRSED